MVGLLSTQAQSQLDSEPETSFTVTSTQDLSADEWSSASELKMDSDANVEYQDFSSESAEPITNSRVDEDLDVSHSGIEEFAYQLSDERANTGSVTLDSTVYPVPDTASGDPVELVLVSIIIPILVVVGGIILERILNRWWNKRKSMRQYK